MIITTCMIIITVINLLFFLLFIIAGVVEASSRRMGNRSKSLLKKGQSLGERAILEGEPAGETCSAGSPVLALIVNRQAPHEAHVHCCNNCCHRLQRQAKPS